MIEFVVLRYQSSYYFDDRVRDIKMIGETHLDDRVRGIEMLEFVVF